MEDGGAQEDGNDDTEKPGENGDGGNLEDGNDNTEKPGENGDGGNLEDGNDNTEKPGENGDGGNLEGGNDDTEKPGENGDDGNLENGNDDTEEEGGSNDAESETHSDSEPEEDSDNGIETTDETARVQDDVFLVQSGVFVMPVYLSEPEALAEPQTMEKKEESVMITGVTWQSEPAYDGNVEGDYVFTANLPEGYALLEGVALPQITVKVQGTDPLVQELLARIAALPEAEDCLADEPEVEEKDEYEAWMEEISAYAAEALDLLETYETLTEEQQAQIPAEALDKLAAWAELAELLAEGSQVMAAADGWQEIADSSLEWQLVDGTLTIRGSGDMPDLNDTSKRPWGGSCGSIKSVIIEDGVTSIGNSAFFLCSNLTSITIPDSVTNIGVNVFHGCSSLESVEIPKNVTEIKMQTFISCKKLTSITIPNSVQSIGDRAFQSCE